jgi:hypothetical protein
MFKGNLSNTIALARSGLISWNGLLGEENTFPVRTGQTLSIP